MNKLMPNSESWNKIEAFKRDILSKLLSECTKEQQVFFLRMYPEGSQNMSESKIPRERQQVEATIKKNKEG